MTNSPQLQIPARTLNVHPLCLGGNLFGWSADESQSQAVLDANRQNSAKPTNCSGGN